MSNQYRHQRGEIRESAVKALVTDPLFKPRIERNKKGKGSYQRRPKHRGENPFKNGNVFKWVFVYGFSKLRSSSKFVFVEYVRIKPKFLVKQESYYV